eukprot:7949816-Pyramimonas_sp.AAC.1
MAQCTTEHARRQTVRGRCQSVRWVSVETPKASDDSSLQDWGGNPVNPHSRSSCRNELIKLVKIAISIYGKTRFRTSDVQPLGDEQSIV